MVSESKPPPTQVPIGQTYTDTKGESHAITVKGKLSRLERFQERVWNIFGSTKWVKTEDKSGQKIYVSASDLKEVRKAERKSGVFTESKVFDSVKKTSDNYRKIFGTIEMVPNLKEKLGSKEAEEKKPSLHLELAGKVYDKSEMAKGKGLTRDDIGKIAVFIKQNRDTLFQQLEPGQVTIQKKNITHLPATLEFHKEASGKEEVFIRTEAGSQGGVKRVRFMVPFDKEGLYLRATVRKKIREDSPEISNEIFGRVEKVVNHENLKNHPHYSRLAVPHKVTPKTEGDIKNGSKPAKPALLMPYYEGGDLKQALLKQPQEKEKISILYDTIQGIHALHDNELVHGDIAPDNILLDTEGRAYVHDFDTTVALNEKRPFGKQGYMPPGEEKGTLARTGNDIYAFGCVAYITLTETYDFDRDKFFEKVPPNLNEVMDKLKKGKKLSYDQVMKSLILACTDPKIDSRPSAQMVENYLEFVKLRMEQGRIVLPPPPLEDILAQI
jgi:serine/threonine protein kinase